MAILVDPNFDAQTLRHKLYTGDLVVLTRLGAVRRLVDHVRQELESLFAPHPPETAHRTVDREAMAAVLGTWKPGFIHSAVASDLVRDAIREAGFAEDATHYDVPRPRTSFPVGHLTNGIAYAFPWHRDTWYAAPAQQVNWWLPVYPLRADNAMGFDPAQFFRAVPNTSDTFDYYRNNQDRRRTAQHVEAEGQARPAAIGHEPQDETVVLPEPGAVLLFSGAHLHRSIPNTSGRARFSVDFRTVDAADVASGTGAPILDVQCAGTAIRDFVRVSDGGSFAEEDVRRWYGAPPEGAMLVYAR